jgi:hypothetical protein
MTRCEGVIQVERAFTRECQSYCFAAVRAGYTEICVDSE